MLRCLCYAHLDSLALVFRCHSPASFTVVSAFSRSLRKTTFGTLTCVRSSTTQAYRGHPPTRSLSLLHQQFHPSKHASSDRTAVMTIATCIEIQTHDPTAGCVQSFQSADDAGANHGHGHIHLQSCVPENFRLCGAGGISRFALDIATRVFCCSQCFF